MCDNNPAANPAETMSKDFPKRIAAFDAACVECGDQPRCIGDLCDACYVPSNSNCRKARWGPGTSCYCDNCRAPRKSGLTDDEAQAIIDAARA